MATFYQKLTARHGRVLRELASFTLVGGVGCLVDMATLWAVMRFLWSDPYVGRLCSYLAAATFGWACNRRLTFRDARRTPLLKQWLQYLGVNAVGGVTNFAVYSGIVAAFAHNPEVAAWLRALVPYIGVAVGSLAGLALNFMGSKKLIFR